MTTLRSVLLATLCISCPTAPAHAQPPDPRVDSVFAEYDTPNSPGCALGVYRDGQIVYARGYGLADLERRVPITPATVFDLGSTSKQFAAAVIVLLAQEGKLSLDDDVRRFIPELPQYEKPITVRQLLHHTSGVRDYIGLLRLTGARYDDVTTPDDALQMIVRQRALNFAPGSEHLYSNSGYFLLSQIVERVTKRSLRDEAHDRIFAPLGMTNTEYLGSYDDIILNRAIGYEPRDSSYRADMPRWLQLGDGAIFSTVQDLLHWHNNFFTNKLGGTALRDTMLTRGVLTNGKVLDYALGLMHSEQRGLPTVMHGGSWGGYRAQLVRFPEQRYGVAVLCNRADSDPTALAAQVAEVHLSAEMNAAQTAAKASLAATASANASTSTSPAAANNVKPRALASYEGSYRAPGTSNIVRVAIVDGALRVIEPGRYDLKPRSGDEVEVVNTPAILRFTFDSSSANAVAASVTEVIGREPGSTYVRMQSVSASPQTLAARVGTYSSDELGTTLVIAQRDTVLELRLRNAAPARLRTVGEHEMVGAGLSLEFTRDASGAVTGLLMTQGRARGLRFERVGPPR